MSLCQRRKENKHIKSFLNILKNGFVIYFIISTLIVIFWMSRSSANLGDSVKIGYKIIYALDDYKNKYGHYPEYLEDIKPEFLIEIPATANSIHKTFRYNRYVDQDDNIEKYKLYFWSGIMDYDQILYISDQRYHRKKDGSEYDKIYDWIHVSYYDGY